MIESIKFRDWRGIKSGTIEGFRKINLLVGPNNSGKSAVLEAIYLACAASRKAGMVDEDDQRERPKESKPAYDTTVVERDLLDDHAMQRVWAKHAYALQQDDLGKWESGTLKVHQKNAETRLPVFSLTPAGLFQPGDERFTAVFGLESQDRTNQSYEAQLAEIQGRILTLRRELETPFREGIVGIGEEQERSREREVEKLQNRIADDEKYKGELEKAERVRGERIKLLADQLMSEGLPGFSQSRLMYCWHSDLSHGYKGDAAWIVKGGKIPLAKHVTLHDLVKVTGYLPREFLRENFLQHPERLEKLTKSFGRIMGFSYCAIQFQPAPGDDRLSQAWVAGDGPFVPIDAFGDGARSVFKLLLTLHTLVALVSEAEPGLLIWEEPELFQNPQTLSPLVEEVVGLINTKPVQVFAASHSLETAGYFIRAFRNETRSRDDLVIIGTRLYGTKLLSSAFNDAEAEAWINMGKDLRTPSGKTDSPITYQLEETDDNSAEHC
jgi:hypothetical protein